MTLRQKISLQIGAMLVGLLLVSGASLWGIDAVRQDYGVALEGYQRLRQIYGVGTHLSTAQTLLQWPHPQAVAAARREVQAAAREFDPLVPPAGPPIKPGDGWDASTAMQVRVSLQGIATNLGLLEQSPDGPIPALVKVNAQRDAIIAQLANISKLSSGIRQATEDAQRAADTKRRTVIGVLSGVGGAVVLAAIVLGVLHYRGVMGPLRRLTRGVHQLTAGQFKGRVNVTGKDELASLARDFNRMAEELDGFYHELERKVAEKGRELVRSERLASVGYLAAGVAHEINNPLGIISGYAEYSLAELERGGNGASRRNGDSSLTPVSERTREDPDFSAGIAQSDPGLRSTSDTGVVSEVTKSLRIICDEAFRCKTITQKLLSLARGGDEARKPVSLLAVANEVASIVGGLQEHRDKRLIVRAPEQPGEAAGEALVVAVEAEMKQVLLNLTVNALEAVEPERGEVRIDLRRSGEHVELAVTDNGRGMLPATLERVFEPFFTEKRGVQEDGRRGTGLGLSITHAIVQDHGGTIAAHSEGPGRGSRFVVRLPAAP